MSLGVSVRLGRRRIACLLLVVVWAVLCPSPALGDPFHMGPGPEVFMAFVVGMATALALVTEMTIVGLFALLRRLKPGQPLKLLAVCLVANLITVPLLWYSLSQFPDFRTYSGRITDILLAEVVVTVLEGIAYAGLARIRLREGLELSLLANGASFGAWNLIIWLGMSAGS